MSVDMMFVDASVAPREGTGSSSPSTSVGQDQMQAKLGDEILRATQLVLSTMMGLDAKGGEPIVDACGPEVAGSVLAMVGMVGPWTGSGAVTCSEKMACKLTAAMMMSQYDKVNDEVMDAMGEVANMVIGGVKTRLEEIVGAMAMGIPTVTFGSAFITRSTVKQNWIRVPFTCEGETFYVEAMLAESSQLAHAHRTAPDRVPVEPAPVTSDFEETW